MAAAWINLFVSEVTVAEIVFGILVAENEGTKLQLEAWLEQRLLPLFEGRILPVSIQVWVRWRLLLQHGRRLNRTYSQPDLFLAATALEHNLTLVTRNTKDFADIPNLQLLDPWD